MTFHEEFRRENHSKKSSDRSFGIVFAAFCALMTIRHAWLFGAISPLWGGTALVFLLSAFFRPQILAPLNWAWTKLGLLLFVVVSPIVLAVLYALCFVPIGVLAKITGKRFLQLKKDHKVETYWIARVPPGPAPEGMRNQF